MKHIVFVISSLQNLGGTERVVITLANHLSNLYNVTIISRDLNGKANAYHLDQSVNDIKISKGGALFLFSVKKYINAHNPDYVIIHTMSKLTPMLLLSRLKAKRFWSMEHISYEFHNRLFQKLRKLLYSKLDKVLVFTEDQKKIYSKFNSNVNIIKNPSPLEINTQSYSIKSKTVISIGRLNNQKGYDLLIKGWVPIERKHPDWTLNIYGDGEDKEKLNRLIQKHSLKNVSLCGPILDVCSVYDSASFYVMSSRYEGLPMVLIEAQSRGLPIISFDCPTGPREIIEDNLDGFLIPSGNIDILSEKISLLINNPDKRISMSDEAKKSARMFTLSMVVEEWNRLLANPLLKS